MKVNLKNSDSDDKSFTYVSNLKKNIVKNEFKLNLSKLFTLNDYALAENLTASLIREDVSSPRGYRGVLAENWVYDKTLKSLVFKIHRNIKWSDGSNLNPKDLVNHLNTFHKEIAPLHIKELTKLTNWIFDDKTSTLQIKTEPQSVKKLLYELSTPDAALSSSSWSKTLGAYFVNSVKKEKNQVELSLNPFFVNYEESSPKTVFIKHLESSYPKQESDLTSLKGDFYYAPPLSVKSEFIQIAEKKGYKAKRGDKNFVNFLVLPLKMKKEARLQLYSLICSLKNNIPKEEFSNRALAPAWQMFSLGYNGRLENLKTNTCSTLKEFSNLTNLDLVDGNNSSKSGEFEFFFKELEKKGLKFNIIKKENFSEKSLFLYSYMGNPKEHHISWNFLANSVFETHYKEFKKSHNGLEYDKFHMYLIENHFAIPLFFFSMTYLISNKIDKIEKMDPYNMAIYFNKFHLNKK